MTKLNRKCLYALFSIIAIVAIVFAFTPQFAFASAATQSDFAGYFSGGDGSPSNPFLITNETELRHINDTAYEEDDIYYIDYCFKIVNDIYLTQEIWVPIYGFLNGTIDGNNKTIYNMKVYAGGNDDYGFIRHIDYYGVIKNLTFSNATLKWVDNGNIIPTVGTIAGNNSGTITNCKVVSSTIDVGAYGAFVGGIAGSVNRGTISYCENSATVTGTGTLGGIVGYTMFGKIENCTNNGQITYSFNTLNGCAAGIVGKAEDNSKIKSCKNNGLIRYGGNKAFNFNIKPCMATIVGWSVSATLEGNNYSPTNLTDYNNLYSFQKTYCKEGYIGRTGA